MPRYRFERSVRVHMNKNHNDRFALGDVAPEHIARHQMKSVSLFGNILALCAAAVLGVVWLLICGQYNDMEEYRASVGLLTILWQGRMTIIIPCAAAGAALLVVAGVCRALCAYGRDVDRKEGMGSSGIGEEGQGRLL